MGAVNDQVRMGAPLGRLRLTRVELGRIHELGAVPGIQINQTEAIGLIAGGGLLLGSSFVKGPAGVLMTLLGAAGIGFSAYYILSDVLAMLPSASGAFGPGAAGSVPGAAAGFASSAAAPALLPPPMPKPTKTQTALQITSAAAPAIAELAKGLVSLF